MYFHGGLRGGVGVGEGRWGWMVRVVERRATTNSAPGRGMMVEGACGTGRASGGADGRFS